MYPNQALPPRKKQMQLDPNLVKHNLIYSYVLTLWLIITRRVSKAAKDAKGKDDLLVTKASTL